MTEPRKQSQEAFRKKLTKQIQAIASDLIDMAPDIVGDTDWISSLEIKLKFPQDSFPSIEIVREHLSNEVWKLLQEGKEII